MTTSPDLPERPSASGAAARTTPPGTAAGTPNALRAPAGGPSEAVRGAVRLLRREHEQRARTARAREVSVWLTRSARAAGLGSPFPAAGRADTGASLPDPASDPLMCLLGQLRAVTTRYVCRMRADGTPPERMVVRVKECVRDAMTAEGWRDPEAVQTITSAVVSWSIAAYYDR